MKNYNPTYKKLFTTFLVFTIFSSTQSIAQLDLTYEEQFDIGGDTNRSHTQRSETADINADGWPDIFDANSNNIPNNTNNIIRFNNQNASFNAEPVLEGPENVNSIDIGLVDFNRDGYPDLIRLESIVTSEIGQVFIYRNLQGNGSDGFGRNWFNLNSPSASTNENCANHINFGDLNNDGWTDFIVAHQGNDCRLDNTERSGISVYLNTSSENSNGDISFEFSTQIQAPSRSTRFNSVIIVKGNGDDFPDIVAFNPTITNIATDFYINSGGQSPSFTEHPGGENLGFSNSLGAVADFNLDGVDDIVTYDIENKTINIFIQRVVPSRFTPFKGFAIADHIIIDSPEIRFVHDIEIGDFDLNGIPDIFISGAISDTPDTQLFVAELTRSRTVSFNKAPTSLLPNQDIRHPYGTGNALDYDLDGDLDIYISGAGFDTRFETPCSTIFCFPNRFYKNTIPLVMNGSENTSYVNFENSFNSSWSQGSTDTHNWTVTNGATPSFNTGPSRAKSGNNYLYLETSASGGANARGNTAFFISPVIQSINISQVLSFDYHMFGSNIGSLHIDLIKPASSTSSLPGEVLVEDIFVLEGAQQSDSIDAWKTATVNLRPSLSASFSAFETPRYMVRIRAVAAAGFRGDIALDNLIIKTNPQAISEQID